MTLFEFAELEEELNTAVLDFDDAITAELDERTDDELDVAFEEGIDEERAAGEDDLAELIGAMLDANEDEIPIHKGPDSAGISATLLFFST